MKYLHIRMMRGEAMVRKKSGFTLTELLIVIGILAVLAAIAIPVVVGLMNRGSNISEDVNAALYTSIMNKYAVEDVGEASDYPRLTSTGSGAEYAVFAAKAGQGSFPGFNIIAGPTNGDVIAQIRKEAVIAIKAFSDTAVSDDYYINPPADADYEYVYYYITGNVKKMKRSDLKVTSADEFVDGELNIADYWVYLSRDGGSGAALGGISNGVGHLFIKILQFGTDEPLTGATVTVRSGAKTFTGLTKEGQNGYVGFSGIPEGSVSISVSYSGAVSFPNSSYYTKNGEIIISPSGYEGCQMNSPYTVYLKLGSMGSIGFYEESLVWNGSSWNTSRSLITDSVAVSTDFVPNTGKSGGYPRAEAYLTNLSVTNGVQPLLDGDKFLTYGHYRMTVSAYGYRTYREDIESRIYGLSNYTSLYDGYTSPYEYPVVLRAPAGKGVISGTITYENFFQPLYGVPAGLTGTYLPTSGYGVKARVKLKNLSTGSVYYSAYFLANTGGKYPYSIGNLPDGSYSFEIESPYGYSDLTTLPSTITIDGRHLYVSGAVKKTEASTGKFYGYITYDGAGNYDPIYNASVYIKRMGDSYSSTVTSSSTGYFSFPISKRGYYQVKVSVPSELGGGTYYYKLFIDGYNYFSIRIPIAANTASGTVKPFLTSTKEVSKKGTLKELSLVFTRTNASGSIEYSKVETIPDTSGVSAIYSASLVPGYYYATLSSTCYDGFVSAVFRMNASRTLEYHLYVDQNSKSNHPALVALNDKTGHWNECPNCETVFDFEEHNSTGWEYYSTSCCYRYCTDCQYVTSEPTAHNMASYISKASTCTTAGVRTYYCTKGCGYSYTQAIAVSGHKANGVWVYDNNGSASSAGTHHQNCSVCKTAMNSGSACSRSGFISNGATNHYDSCSKCGGKRYFNHSWSETSRSGYACTGGTIYYKCSNCSATKTGSYGATASHNEKARCATRHSATWNSYCSAGGTHKWNGYYHILCSVCGNVSDNSANWCAIHCGSSLVQKPCPVS